jgi:tight adherence protein B
MGVALGVTAGVGVLLVWWSWWEQPIRNARRDGWSARVRDDLTQAGLPGVSPGRIVGASLAAAAVAFVLAAGLTGSPAIGGALGTLAARAPMGVVRGRARRRRAVLRDVWPDAVDNLGSAIRAGLSLPEALSSLGDKGPREIRPHFEAFAADFRTTGRFDGSIDTLKERLADPIADRIIESLRVTREVGGSDLGRVLRSLSTFLREDARTRGELEARQSWTVNAARLAVVAPWVVLVVLSTRPEAASAYDSPAGVTVLAAGAASTVIAYRLMVRVGRLPVERRVMR